MVITFAKSEKSEAKKNRESISFLGTYLKKLWYHIQVEPKPYHLTSFLGIRYQEKRPNFLESSDKIFPNFSSGAKKSFLHFILPDINDFCIKSNKIRESIWVRSGCKTGYFWQVIFESYPFNWCRDTWTKWLTTNPLSGCLCHFYQNF